MRYAQAFSFDFGLRRNSLAAWGHQHFLRNADKASLAAHPLHFLHILAGPKSEFELKFSDCFYLAFYALWDVLYSDAGSGGV